MPQMCTASARVRDDHVKIFWGQGIDGLAGQDLSEVARAVVGVEGAAAVLLGRGMDRAAVGQERIRCIAVDIGKNQILDATGQERHPSSGRRFVGGRPLHGRYQFVRKFCCDARSEGLESAEVCRKQAGQTQSAHQRFNAAALINPKQASGQPQRPRIHKQDL